jgi:COX assembly mitochondrial protein 2
MHPHLEGERFVSCYELIQALNECHQRSFLEQAIGVCNTEKEYLSRCLHDARIADVKSRSKKSKEISMKRQEIVNKMKEEEFGEGKYLKTLLFEKIKERDAKLASEKASKQ